MRIGINALSAANRSGTGYYTQNLILALSRVKSDHEYFVFLPEDCLLTTGARPGENQDGAGAGFARRLRRALAQSSQLEPLLISRRNLVGRIAWEQTFLPREAERLGLKLLHSPTGIAPIRLQCPSIITLHDMAFLRYPELFDRMHRTYLNWILPRSARRARMILTDSETVRREIMDLLGVPEEKVLAIPLGVDERFQPVEDDERLAEVRRRYSLPEQFILALGTVEPRKNLLQLLEAFARLTQKVDSLSLVLVGRRGWKEEPVFERIEQLRLAERIVWTGFLPDEDLPAVYSLASVCAYLSVYEGFGLPVLEAMACGTPVVASDIPVFREWTEGAALLVPPKDTEAIADGLYRLLSREEERRHYRQAGLDRASRLNWQHTAEATLKAYCQASS